MEKLTQNVISHLLLLNTINEAIDYVNAEHEKLKTNMLAYGVKFYNNELPLSQGIVMGQQFNNDDEILNVRNYEEINYIRVGLNMHWIYDIYEPQRYIKIKKSVQAIADIYKLDRRKNVPDLKDTYKVANDNCNV